ncbi:MAG TPA: hypothetical protein VGD43_06030 [Micromonospora sp.]
MTVTRAVPASIGRRRSSKMGSSHPTAQDRENVAIPKKGSRLIVVDGALYRWNIRRQAAKGQLTAQSPLSFAVELVLEPGRILVVATRSPAPDNPAEDPSEAVQPALVEQSIRAALDRGWQPDLPGPPFHLKLPQLPDVAPALPG